MYNIAEKDLIDFEEDIANCFNDKQIKAPVHLYNGNEKQLIDYFTNYVNNDDWIMCSWRNHYQCLLHGVPKDKLRKDILDGKSITLSYPEHNILSSAIVGGILPIALGTALAIKISGGTNKVHVFVGDMTAETGSYHEVEKYANNHSLPLRIVVEDNGVSVCTPTREVWGIDKNAKAIPDVYRYVYKSKYPHAGAGARIQF